MWPRVKNLARYSFASTQKWLKPFLFSCLGVLSAIFNSLCALVGSRVRSWALAAFSLHSRVLHSWKSDHELAFCFTFVYFFPYIVLHLSSWAPAWAAPTLWHGFLIRALCIHGPPLWITMSRLALPLVFVCQISHHSFMLDLNGGERLAIALLLTGVRTHDILRPTFLLIVASLIIVALLSGYIALVQWGVFVASILAMGTASGISELADIHKPATAAA